MRRKILIAVLAVPALVLLAGLLYLKFGDLGRFRGTIERRISEALGRDLTIAGKFNLDVLFTPRLVAEEVMLSNSGWSDESDMVHIDRIELSVSLWSLLRGPVRVHDLKLEGVRVRLERDAEGRANWDFDLGGGNGDSQVVLESVRVQGFELTLDEPSRESPMRLEIDRLRAGPDTEGMFALDLAGQFDRIPVELSGRVTPVERLLAGEAMEFELSGQAGQVELSARGSIADVASLEGTHVEIRASGADIASVTDWFDLPSLGSGPFSLSGRATPSVAGVDLALDADLVELQIEVRGSADTWVDPRDLRLELKASGANLSAAGTIFGWKTWPEGAFKLSGTLSGDGTRTILEELKMQVHEHALSIDGVIRTSSEIVDEELRFEAAGPDLSAFSAMAGVSLPERSYRLTGHLVRQADGIGIKALVGRIGEIELRMSGTLDEVLRLAGADVNMRMTGPDLSVIESLAGVALPAGSFDLDGRFRTEASTLVLDSVKIRVGENTILADGVLSSAPGLAGTELHARVTGRDPGWIAPLTGLPELPAEPYDLGGSIRFMDDGYELAAIVGTYGDVKFALDGHLGVPPEFDATDLSVRVSGSDLSWFAALGEVSGLPAERFEFAGRVRPRTDGYQLEGVQVSIGDIAVTVQGWLADLPEAEGTDLEVQGGGPDLSALSTYFELPQLPAEPFTVRGRVMWDTGAFRLVGVSGELGQKRFAVDGTLVPSEGMLGSDLEVEVSGPDLADAGRIAGEVGVEGLPELPPKAYALSGQLRVLESGYELRQVALRVGEAQARLDGTLGRLPELYGTDLSIASSGPDASILATIVGVPLPAEPFSVHGRVERLPDGIRCHDVVAKLGSYHAEIDGTLGELPKLVGTNLDIRAQGPDLSRISDLVDLPPLPDEPFEFSAHFDGNPEQFAMHHFAARLGRSDVSGMFRADLRGGKPDLQGELASKRVDLDELLRDENEEKTEVGASGGLLLSDEPLDFELLDELDADIRWTVGELTGRHLAFENAEMGLHLLDGRLRLDPLTAEGYGGTISGALTLEPAEDGYRLHVRSKAEQAHISLLSFGGDPRDIAPIDTDLELTGVGRSLHAIASTADGRLLSVQGAGKIDNSMLTAIAADPLSKLYAALNPFTKNEPYTKLECSVLLIELEDGVATIGPLAMRTDKMVMLGKGRIDFKSEKLKLGWVTKPRKGVGLSAATVTNSYIQVGGTLSRPKLEISPLSAARTTGAIVMTGGLWLLYKSVFNRVTAERKVCELALKKIDKKAKKTPRR